MRLGTEAGTGDAGGALHLSPEVAVVRPRAEINVGTDEPQQPEPSRRRLPQAPGKAGASGVRCWAPVDRPWRQRRPITPGRCFCLEATARLQAQPLPGMGVGAAREGLTAADDSPARRDRHEHARRPQRPRVVWKHLSNGKECREEARCGTRSRCDWRWRGRISGSGSAHRRTRRADLPGRGHIQRREGRSRQARGGRVLLRRLPAGRPRRRAGREGGLRRLAGGRQRLESGAR